MRANRREPVSVPFWFQSIKCRPHGGLLQSGKVEGLSLLERQQVVFAPQAAAVASEFAT